MHRFIVPPGALTGDLIELPGDEAAHALRVLRLGAGDEVELCDARGQIHAGIIERAERGSVRVRMGEAIRSREAPVRVTLYQGVPKLDKLDWIVQKATELGVSRIVPVGMERCVVRLDAKDAVKRTQRLEKIAVEAVKQCGRAIVPEICPPMTFDEAMAEFRGQSLCLMPWEGETARRLLEVRSDFAQVDSVAILIGPEGGISKREADEARCAGAQSVTLGPRILRTETAAVTSIAIVMALWGDMA